MMSCGERFLEVERRASIHAIGPLGNHKVIEIIRSSWIQEERSNHSKLHEYKVTHAQHSIFFSVTIQDRPLAEMSILNPCAAI